MTRAKRPMAATFGAVAKKAAIGVGAPSYTSGVHMWNGTAETLKARPEIRNTRPKSSPSDVPPVCAVVIMPAKSVVPA